MRSLLGIDEDIVNDAGRDRVQLESLERCHRQLNEQFKQFLFIRERVQVFLKPGKKPVGILLLRMAQVFNKPVHARGEMRFYTVYRFHVLVTRRQATGFTPLSNG